MPTDALVVSASPGETRIALLEGGQVIEFVIDRGDPAPGDVVEGRVIEVVPALVAAFVEIGAGPPGFLARPMGASVGTRVIVEVMAAARPGKGPELRLAADGAAPGRRPALPRVLAEHPGVRRVSVDDRSGWVEARAVFPAAAHAPDCWSDSGAADALDEALARRVMLPGGAALDFAETPAATLIDVDGAGLAPAAANKAAVPAVARHLRLRAIGGHVLVDLIPTRNRREAAAQLAALRHAVADDPAPVQVAGRTPLGMIELTRRRRGPSLAELMLEPAAAGPTGLTLALDAVRALLREADARPLAAPTLVLPPRAAHALLGRAAIMSEVNRRLGRPLAVVERPGLDSFLVQDAR